MAEYAVPTDVRTILETGNLIVQVATMRSLDDVQIYVKQCEESCRCLVSYTGLEVTVCYPLDADGKIY